MGTLFVIQYPDGTQADYWYDAENQMTEMVDFDRGMSKFKFDPNGNVIEKEYPNYETAYYLYDDWNHVVQMDEFLLNGTKQYKTTYSWDAEGNRLSEMQYNHGQSGILNDTPDTMLALPELPTTTPTTDPTKPNKGNNGKGKQKNPAAQAIADMLTMPNPLADTQAGLFLEPNTAEQNEQIIADSKKEDATVDGNGNGNGEVPPGQTEDEDGNIVNPGGNEPPGLNKGDKPSKPDHPNKPGKPDHPGNEDGSDAKAQKGTHIYTYDKLNRVVTGDVAKVKTNYTYDTLGNLVLEKSKNNVIDYQYNNLNQLIQKSIKKDVTTFTYDKRGNRLAETGKKASQSFVYDATNHLVKGTNWKGETSEYTYNALFVRVNQSQTNNGNKTYARDYVIDYTSYERNDLAVFSPGYMEQKHLYTAWGERTEQFTERGNWDRLLYVHEDVMGNTRYYTKATGMTFAELQYDVWGAIASPNKLENNDNGNFVAANFTGHIYDTVLDIYFAEARFYDAKSRQWMSSDPIKDGLNWYAYCASNPVTYFDPDGLYSIRIYWVEDDDEDDEDDSSTEPVFSTSKPSVSVPIGPNPDTSNQSPLEPADHKGTAYIEFIIDPLDHPAEKLIAGYDIATMGYFSNPDRVVMVDDAYRWLANKAPVLSDWEIFYHDGGEYVVVDDQLVKRFSSYMNVGSDIFTDALEKQIEILGQISKFKDLANAISAYADIEDFKDGIQTIAKWNNHHDKVTADNAMYSFMSDLGILQTKIEGVTRDEANAATVAMFVAAQATYTFVSEYRPDYFCKTPFEACGMDTFYNAYKTLSKLSGDAREMKLDEYTEAFKKALKSRVEHGFNPHNLGTDPTFGNSGPLSEAQLDMQASMFASRYRQMLDHSDVYQNEMVAMYYGEWIKSDPKQENLSSVQSPNKRLEEMLKNEPKSEDPYFPIPKHPKDWPTPANNWATNTQRLTLDEFWFYIDKLS